MLRWVAGSGGEKAIEEWFLVSTNFALSSQTVHQLVKLKGCKSILVLELATHGLELGMAKTPG